ncbi:hypothetical protein A3Q56_06176 [Intoshia linei]|uniref:Uncharacterized protein n=1 Tax=Intoshia linei TaxID=1819745 RepID=A0A177AVT1_9BILA|nr:hypothetical protein A3Q56_06176 [Intoshia linei]
MIIYIYLLILFKVASSIINPFSTNIVVNVPFHQYIHYEVYIYNFKDMCGDVKFANNKTENNFIKYGNILLKYSGNLKIVKNSKFDVHKLIGESDTFVDVHIKSNVTENINPKHLTILIYGDLTGGFAESCNDTIVPINYQKLDVEFYGKKIGTSNQSTLQNPFVLQKIVSISKSILSKVFLIVVIILIVIINLQIGFTIQLKTVKRTLMGYKSILVCCFCQFIVLPLIAIAVTTIMNPNKILKIALLLTACAPGGTGSTYWTVLLEGNVSFSMTMTFINKIISIGTMNIWVFVLNNIFTLENKIHLPYKNIAYGIVLSTVPFIIGIIIREKFEKMANTLSKFKTVFIVIFILWVTVFGSYVYYYTYFLLVEYYKTSICIIILPFITFIISFGSSYILKFEESTAVTISTEATVQDTGLVIIIILSGFAAPYADIMTSVPILFAISTPIPLILMKTCLLIRHKCIIKQIGVDEKRNQSTNV